MKAIALSMSFLFAFLGSEKLNAQTGVAVNITGAAPNASAMLDVSSTSKGLLIPRMTDVQRNAIATPANGLVVFVTTDSSFYYYYNAWQRIAPGSENWNTKGNSGTSAATNFIGTTDNNALISKVNNQTGGQLIPGSGNLAWGVGSISSITSGNYNTAIGSAALTNNTTGNDNTSIGFTALRNNTTGINNTASGSNAMYNNNSGSNNTASGYFSLITNVTGNNNTAYGYRSLVNNFPGIVMSELESAHYPIIRLVQIL